MLHFLYQMFLLHNKGMLGVNVKSSFLWFINYNNATVPLALRGDLGLRAGRASGVDHQRELHQRVTAISELVVLAVLHSWKLISKQIMLLTNFSL